MSIQFSQCQWQDLFGAIPAASGVPVTYDTVWNVAPFWKGVDLIASKIATINCDVMLDTDGNKEQYKTHPVFKVLRGNVAPWLSAFAWKQLAIKEALWAGNHYSLILRKNPVQLIPLDPRHVAPWITRDLDTFEIIDIFYRVTVQGVMRDIPYSDIIHIKGMCESGGYWGMPLLEYAKDVLGLCNATIRYGSSFFRNNLTPSLVVEVPAWLQNKEQVEKFEATINRAPGPDEAWKSIILQNGATAKFPPPPSNESAQFLGSMEMSAIIASQLLGLPASKLGARSENSSYNSLSADELSIYKDCINRWMTVAEIALAEKLLTEKEKASGLVSIEFNRHQLLEGDPQQTIQLINEQLDSGLLTENEARRLMNYKKVNHPNADKHRMPSHSVFLEDIVKPDPAQSTEQVEGKPQTPEVWAGQPASGHTQRAKQLTEISVSRLLNRLRKAGKNFHEHREVMMEALQPFERANEWIDGLLGELEAVLPEQVGTVLDRCDPKQVTEELWTI